MYQRSRQIVAAIAIALAASLRAQNPRSEGDSGGAVYVGGVFKLPSRGCVA